MCLGDRVVLCPSSNFQPPATNHIQHPMSDYSTSNIQLFGIHVQVLAEKSQTGNGWSSVLYTAPPFFPGPPLHYHRETEEGFFVHKGTLTITLNGETRDLEAGDFVLVPAGAVHTFSNRTDQPVTMLCFFTPGGFEDYFRELAIMAANSPTWPPADKKKWLDLQEQYDTIGVQE